MRSVKNLAIILLLLFLVAAFTAAGSSPLATQDAQVGPYRLLLSFYSLPRVGQQLNMTIQSKIPGQQVQFSQVVLNPAPGTDANTVRVSINPDADNPAVYDVYVTPPVRGPWLLHLTIKGSTGSVTGNIPISVAGPPVIPTWLGWLIGLLPLPLLIAFIWLQVNWRKARREQVKQEALQKPSL